MDLEGWISRRYEYDTTITIGVAFLDRKAYFIGVIDDQEPRLLFTKTRKPILCCAFVRLDSSDPCNGRERLFGMFIGASINPKDSPKSSICNQLQIVAVKIPCAYLCLLSEANLQQNCVLPDPGRP